MLSFSWKYFKVIWIVLCIIATMSTTIWQLWSYVNGDDITVVGYKKFNEEEIDLYPSVSVCFTMALDEEKLGQYGINLNRQTYALFLGGELWSQEMLQIPYDNVTFNFDDYIVSYGVTTNYWVPVTFYDASNRKDGVVEKPHFEEVSLFGIKCFTLNVPFVEDQKLQNSFVRFKTDIFPS